MLQNDSNFITPQSASARCSGAGHIMGNPASTQLLPFSGDRDDVGDLCRSSTLGSDWTTLLLVVFLSAWPQRRGMEVAQDSLRLFTSVCIMVRWYSGLLCMQAAAM